ncbi:MAG: DUF4928 family protein [Capsulimonadaceae bacterium]
MKHLVFQYDPAKSLRFMVDDVITQAFARQKRSRNALYADTVLRYLVGAKLELSQAFPTGGSCVAFITRGSAERSSDFEIGDVVFYCTTAPSETLMRNCRANTDGNRRPIIITTANRFGLADGLAGFAGIDDCIEIFEASQFIAGSLHQRGLFQQHSTWLKVNELIERYNRLVKHCETDPSMMIKVTKTEHAVSTKPVEFDGIKPRPAA